MSDLSSEALERLNRLPESLRDWAATGWWHGADCEDIFVKQFRSGGWEQQAAVSTAEPLVLIHGFPTSSADWHRVLPYLQPHHDLILMDFPGFGLSSKPVSGRYSLIDQCDRMLAVLRELSVRRCRVICHDMGNSVLCEWLHQLGQGADVPEITRIDLLNGGLYMSLHRPLLTQRLLRTPIIGELAARLSSRRVFMHQYPKVYAHPEQFDAAHYQQQWDLMCHARGRRVWAKTAIYMHERVRNGERWLGALHESRIPLQVIWGMADPIAVPEIARRLESHRPDARYHWLDNCGHYPQLEAPKAVAELILSDLTA